MSSSNHELRRSLRMALVAAAEARDGLWPPGDELGDEPSTGALREGLEGRLRALNEALLRVGECALDAYRAGVLDVAEHEPAEPAEPAAPAAPAEPAEPVEPAVILSRPEPPRAKVDADVIRALQQSLSEGSLGRPGAVDLVAEHEWQRRAWERLGAVPTSIGSVEAFSAEYDRIRSGSDPERLARWNSAPREVCLRFVELLAARLRHLQTEVPILHRPSHTRGDNAFHAIVRDLAGHMQTYRQGVAHGLARAHTPRYGTWYQDAVTLYQGLQQWVGGGAAPPEEPFNPERALDDLREALAGGLTDEVLGERLRTMLRNGMSPQDPRLGDLLAEHVERLHGSDLKTLRSAIRRAARSAAETGGEAEAGAWPLAGTLTGKRLVLVGGDRHGQAHQRLQERLPGVQVDWIETTPTGGTRQVQALVHSINYGAVDVVLLVQSYLSHKVSRAIAEAARASPTKVRVQVVRRGYGMSQLLDALTRCVTQPADTDCA